VRALHAIVLAMLFSAAANVQAQDRDARSEDRRHSPWGIGVGADVAGVLGRARPGATDQPAGAAGRVAVSYSIPSTRFALEMVGTAAAIRIANGDWRAFGAVTGGGRFALLQPCEDRVCDLWIAGRVGYAGWLGSRLALDFAIGGGLEPARLVRLDLSVRSVLMPGIADTDFAALMTAGASITFFLG